MMMQGRGKERAALEPTLRVNAEMSSEDEEWEEFENLQTIEDSYTTKRGQPSKAMEDRRRNHNYYSALAAEPPPPEDRMRDEPRDLSEGQEPDTITEEHKQKQDSSTPQPKEKKNKHKKKKKGKQTERILSVDDLVPIVAPEDLPVEMRRIQQMIIDGLHGH